MPLYEYKCLKCGRTTEKIEPVSGPHLKKCPHCGGKVEQVLAPPAIQFKGSGWYVTDYAGKGKPGGDSPGDKSAPSKESDSKKESSTKEASSKDSGSKEKKTPAKKE